MASLAGLLLLLPATDDSIKHIAKPYLGEYECKQATLGSDDCLDNVKTFELELLDDGKFRILYQEEGGKRQEFTGKYVYDDKKKTITFVGANGRFKREFPLRKGVLTVSLPMQGKLLVVQFQHK